MVALTVTTPSAGTTVARKAGRTKDKERTSGWDTRRTSGPDGGHSKEEVASCGDTTAVKGPGCQNLRNTGMLWEQRDQQILRETTALRQLWLRLTRCWRIARAWIQHEECKLTGNPRLLRYRLREQRVIEEADWIQSVRRVCYGVCNRMPRTLDKHVTVDPDQEPESVLSGIGCRSKEAIIGDHRAGGNDQSAMQTNTQKGHEVARQMKGQPKARYGDLTGHAREGEVTVGAWGSSGTGKVT